MKELKYALWVCCISQFIYYIGLVGTFTGFDRDLFVNSTFTIETLLFFLCSGILGMYIPGGLLLWFKFKKKFIEKYTLNNSIFNYYCLICWYVFVFVSLIIQMIFFNVSFENLHKDIILFVFPGFIFISEFVGKFLSNVNSNNEGV